MYEEPHDDDCREDVDHVNAINVDLGWHSYKRRLSNEMLMYSLEI